MESSKEKKGAFLKLLRLIFELKGDKALVDNPMFYAALTLPLLVGLFFAFWIFANGDVSLTPDFTAEGYKIFLEKFDFPIKIWALSQVFLLLVIAHHRSLQILRQQELVMAQIELTSLQNAKANFHQNFTLFDEMTKSFQAHGNCSESVNNFNARRFYYRFVQLNNLNLKSGAIKNLEIVIDKLKELLRLKNEFKFIDLHGDSDSIETMLKCMNKMDLIHHDLQLVFGRRELPVEMNQNELVVQLIQELKFIHLILEFFMLSELEKEISDSIDNLEHFQNFIKNCLFEYYIQTKNELTLNDVKLWILNKSKLSSGFDSV